MRERSTPKNGSGENVYLTTVTVQDNDSNTLNNTEVSCTVDTTNFTTKTDSDGKLYLCLPAGDAIIDICSDGVGYRAVGTVTTDDGTALTSAEFNAVASIDDVEYETWAAAVAAVQAGETITLLKDMAILATDAMLAAACTIDGNFHTLTLKAIVALPQHLDVAFYCG